MALFSYTFCGSDHIPLGDINMIQWNELLHFYLVHYPVFSAIKDENCEQASQNSLSRSLIWHGTSRIRRKASSIPVLRSLCEFQHSECYCDRKLGSWREFLDPRLHNLQVKWEIGNEVRHICTVHQIWFELWDRLDMWTAYCTEKLHML